MPARRITSTHRGLHIHHVDPLPKGLACLSCRQRKVRCNGAMPACSTCVRSAKHEGKDTSLVCCEYAPQKRSRRSAVPRASGSISSGTESEDHSDSDMHSESESESYAPRYLNDLTEEPEGIARDLENLAKILNLQLQEAQPYTSSTPILQNSYDSGYSSDSSFASYDAYAPHEDSHSSFFSFDTSSLAFLEPLASTSSYSIISEPLPLSNQYAFVNPSSVFAYPLPPVVPTPREIPLASLPVSGDYFTQSPVDFVKVQPAPVIAPPKAFDVLPLRPEWNSWLTL